MFILPPPPKSSSYYPGSLGYRDGVPIEATNNVTHLDETSSLKFSAPEGTYNPRECIYIATPLPHPSDPPPAVVNPLAPTHMLPSTHSSGMKLSTCRLQDSLTTTTSNSQNLNSSTVKNKKGRQGSNSSSNKSFGGWTQSLFKQQKQQQQQQLSSQTNEDGSMSTNNNNNSEDIIINPPSPSEELLSSSAPLPSNFGTSLTRKDTTLSTNSVGNNEKKKKPKNSLTKNNSSFISRTVIHDNLHKRLAERSPYETFFWCNVGRSVSWIDLSANSKSTRQEALVKILFTKSHPLCHDINQDTKSTTNLDVIIGTSAGDVIWVECVTARYNRLNKNGDVTRSAVTDIKWIPGSENLFMSAHADGTICIFDKEREDRQFVAQGLHKHQDPKNSTDVFRIIKSLHSPALTAQTKNNNVPGPIVNPVAVYKVSNGPITSLKFSPTTQILAVSNKDGYLRLLNLATEQLTDIFPSYYGGFLCSCWSPDGQYLATGGQDDMVCIWNITEKKKNLVVRLQGHSSWIRGVEFDPYASDDVNYRLGSVGDDGKLLLWDFTPKSLNRPKVHNHNNNPQHSSSITRNRANSNTTVELSNIEDTADNNKENTNTNKNTRTTLHPFISQGETPILPPVVSKEVKMDTMSNESLCDVAFHENEVIVAGKDGRVWVWDRPL